MGLTLIEETLSSGIRLRVMPTEQFKMQTIRLFVHTPLAEHPGAKALLSLVLPRGTRAIPESRALAQALDDLYGADLRADVMKFGERQFISLQLTVPSGRYVGERGLLERALAVVRDVVFDPARDGDGGLRKEYVAQEKANLARIIRGIVDDKEQYALYRLVQEMFRGTPFALHRYGSLEEVEALDAAQVTELYGHLVRTAPMDLYVVGDVDAAATAGAAERIFAPVADAREVVALPPLPRAGRDAASERRTVVDRMPMSQGKLAIGLRTGIGFGDAAFPALVVANGVLGGFSHSKLFQNVRERAGMAYYAYSRLEGTQGAAFITAGIEFSHLSQALAIIEAQVDAVRNGEIGDEEMDRTVRALRHHIRVGEDSPTTRILTHLERSLYGMEVTAEARIAELERVTRDEVREAAAGLTWDTVYFLTDARAEAARETDAVQTANG